jgi:hypothetical protein
MYAGIPTADGDVMFGTKVITICEDPRIIENKRHNMEMRQKYYNIQLNFNKDKEEDVNDTTSNNNLKKDLSVNVRKLNVPENPIRVELRYSPRTSSKRSLLRSERKDTQEEYRLLQSKISSDNYDKYHVETKFSTLTNIDYNVPLNVQIRSIENIFKKRLPVIIFYKIIKNQEDDDDDDDDEKSFYEKNNFEYFFQNMFNKAYNNNICAYGCIQCINKNKYEHNRKIIFNLHKIINKKNDIGKNNTYIMYQPCKNIANIIEIVKEQNKIVEEKLLL